MPIYVLVRFNLLLLTCYQRAMVDNHGYPTGYGINANKISPKRNANLGLILDTRRDTIWTVKDDTDGTPQGSTALILKMLSVEHVWIAWWKNSEHRTLRTRLATDSRLNGKSTERTRRKLFLTMDTQRATICTANERKGVIPLRMQD